jgi:hypothetical protein
LIHHGTKVLQGKYPSIEPNILSFIAGQQTARGQISAITTDELALALRRIDPSKSRTADEAAKWMLSEEMLSFSEACKVPEVNRVASYLPMAEKAILARFMATNGLTTFQDAMQALYPASQYTAEETQHINDLMINQKKTLRFIDELYGYKKFQEDYPSLTDEEARAIAAFKRVNNIGNRSQALENYLLMKCLNNDEKAAQIALATLSRKAEPLSLNESCQRAQYISNTT